MGLPSVITQVLSIPSLAPDKVFIGLVINGERVAWGTCVQTAGNNQQEDYPSFDIKNIRQTIQDWVVPILVGQSLEDFKGVVSLIDAVQESAVIIRHPLPKKQSGKISRRELITGKSWAADPEHIPVKRPLHPAIRYGVSHALASALAQEKGITLTEFIALEYNLTSSRLPVPIHLELGNEEDLPDALLLSHKTRSLGYRIAGDDPWTQLGTNGEKLQRFVRQVAEFIGRLTEPSFQPTIQLNLKGRLGQLFDNDAGRILGALYGLEQAAKPYQVRVVDPVSMAEQKTHIELMSQIMDYLRMRQMRLQLAASTGVNSLANVKAFTQAKAAHMLVLTMSGLGSIHQVVEAILTCQRGEIAILLEGPAETAVHLAIATQPDLISASTESQGQQSLSLVYDEMIRTLTWLAQKHNNDG